jgi:phenylpyruvate tautomerase PptA (4-oxalocrotonate tautomerase family)
VPLIRIDVLEGRNETELVALADAVDAAIAEHFAAPPGDRYQIVTEHRPGRMFVEDTGLGIERSDAIVLIQITQQGRTTAQKQALYAGLATILRDRTGLRGEDLVVAVVDNTRADWSFGHGRAQFLEGDL